MIKNRQLNIIAAIAKNGVIGKNNQLPWHLPDDLKYFKQLTHGHTVIMGRKTFESIGKPLPGRFNIVITQQTDYQKSGIVTASNLMDALAKAPENQKIFVIGGASLYQMTLPLAERFYLTEVLADVEGDAYFPKWQREQWECIEAADHAIDDKHEFAFRFLTLYPKRIGFRCYCAE